MKARLLAALLALAAAPALAHEGHDAAPAASEQKGEPVQPLAKPTKRDPQAYFSDRELITQDGKKVRFYSDVLKDKVVVMNTVFTNCKEACPLITEQMTKVRAALGPSFGKEIYFVSISSDPERDTPQAMKKFAAKHKADTQGWIWLTGKKQDIEYVLKRLGQWSEDVEAHSTQLIAWNFKADRGKKMLPNIPPEIIAEQIKTVAGGDSLTLPLPGAAAAPKAN
ncbi:MAG: electron transport protein SCO1/SenC [Proteobacteria bacterium]|jgi:cytochrome oxidase Cu insertion factor (SCO1/SenC/PrrC family)|nr:electron transport protein SCO1/SenC [Pseudomonadota bacterium]